MTEPHGAPLEDAGLARRAAGGESEAFAEIVRRFQHPVFRLCSRFLGRNDAEDAAQETFVRAFVHRERFDPNRPLLPWLLTIARRLCIDRLRKHAAVPDAEIERAPTSEPAADAESTASTNERMRRLQAALQKLPEGQREALMLFHLEDMPYKEIAMSLDVPLGTVMTWLHRGRAALRQMVEEGEIAPMPRTAHPGVSP